MQYQNTEVSYPFRSVIFWYSDDSFWYGIKYIGTEMNRAQVCNVRLVDCNGQITDKNSLPNTLGPDPFGRMTRDSQARIHTNLTSTVKKMINSHTL